MMGSNLLKYFEENKIHKVFIHPNSETFQWPDRQYFSLPSTLIHYITQNPKSPDGLLKLQKSCKYFLAKNKIIVVEKEFIQQGNKLFCFINDNYGKRFYINGFNLAKFWLKETLSIDIHCRLNIPKNIYRCSLRNLNIPNQNLTLNEIDFLMDGGKIIWLNLWNTNIKNSDGTLVSIDKILAKAPNVEQIDYSCKNEIFTNKILENIGILAINSKWNCVRVSFYNFSPDADISLLCNFIRKNANQPIFYSFGLKIDVNKEMYQIILKEAIAEILENWGTTKKPNIYIS